MWNVAVVEVFRIPVHREESISENNKKSPWCSMIMDFARTVL